MEAVDGNSVVLLVADSNFVNLCNDPAGYVERLKNLINKRGDGNVQIMTISGRYGLSGVDKDIRVIEVDDKNKTLFGQHLENISMFFDELLVVTISPTDSYMLVAKEVVTNACKTFTQYGYQRK